MEAETEEDDQVQQPVEPVIQDDKGEVRAPLPRTDGFLRDWEQSADDATATTRQLKACLRALRAMSSFQTWSAMKPLLISSRLGFQTLLGAVFKKDQLPFQGKGGGRRRRRRRKREREREREREKERKRERESPACLLCLYYFMIERVFLSHISPSSFLSLSLSSIRTIDCVGFS